MELGPIGTFTEPNARPPNEPDWRCVNVLRSYAPGMSCCAVVVARRLSRALMRTAPPGRNQTGSCQTQKRNGLHCTPFMETAMFTCEQSPGLLRMCRCVVGLGHPHGIRSGGGEAGRGPTLATSGAAPIGAFPDGVVRHRRVDRVTRRARREPQTLGCESSSPPSPSVSSASSPGRGSRISSTCPSRSRST